MSCYRPGLTIFLALACALAPRLSLAGEAAAELRSLVVTATRTPVGADALNVPVLVIGREEIERSQALDVAELLRFHAGFDLGRNGGTGQNTGLFVRGTESNHTLVLVDGVEINPGTLGGAAIYNMRTDAIERIEIVKGPRSALWGSEAIGGVVNIITRTAEGGSDWSASLGMGEYDTRSASLESRFRGRLGGLSLNFSRLDTGGFPTRSASDLDRAHDNTSLNLKADTALVTSVGTVSIGARYWEASGNTQYLDFFLAPVEQDYRNSALAADVSLRPRERWHSTLTAGRARDEIYQLNSSDFVTTARTTLDWQNTFEVSPASLLMAGVYVAEEETQTLSFGSGFSNASRITALYFSNQLRRDAHSLLLAARNSDHDAFGSALTWNLEYGLDIRDDLRLSAGLGTAFRAPDGTDRFGFGGNPELGPERSRNSELGLVRELGSGRLALSLFQNDIDDLIEFVFDPETFEGGNVNVGRARIRGLDASYAFESGDWQGRFAAVFQNPENRVDGSTLSRRARRSLSASLVRRFARATLGIDLLASDSRRDSPFSDVVNAGYVLANLTAGFDLSERITLRGRLENLLDSRYQTAAGFNSPGRGLYLSLAYMPR